MTRDELIDAIGALPGAHCEPLYYIYSIETDDHQEHYFCFCREHADMVARVESVFVGASMGGLTDYGVDDALALTEENPLESHVYPAELMLSARAMQHDDPRWATWEEHARRMLAERSVSR